MRHARTLLSLAGALLCTSLLAGCDTTPPAPLTPPGVAAHAPRRTVLLISIDGFRADYLDRGITPTLSALAAGGAHAVAMRPSFPSITFPNHTTLVTGLVPDRHGVVSNNMEDPDHPSKRFTLSDSDAVHDPFWWDEATPIWVTAQRQGVLSATEFWPGSTTPIHGVLPAESDEYTHDKPYSDRVDAVLDWLDKPVTDGVKPGFLTLYFEGVDSAGHSFGPDTSEMNAAIRKVDAALARLIAGLRVRHLEDKIDIVVVSDHGMESVPAGHVIRIDQLVPAESADILTDGPIADIRPHPGHEAEVEKALLRPFDVMQCWRRENIPARLQFGTNPRVLPLFCLAKASWVITTHPSKLSTQDGGAHGYDIADPLMGALFIAHGPDFRAGVTLPEFPNVDVYPLLSGLLGIRPEPNQGSTTVFAPALTTTLGTAPR